MPPHPLTNFEIQNITRMNLDLMMFILGIIYLKKIKDGAYVINLDKYADIGMHWIAFFCRKNENCLFR